MLLTAQNGSFHSISSSYSQRSMIFELVLMKNFHEFVHEYLQKPEFTELIRRLGALGDGRPDQCTLSQDEWRCPICISHLSFQSEGNLLPNGKQTTQTTGRCSSPRAILSFSGYKQKSFLIELANSLLILCST